MGTSEKVGHATRVLWNNVIAEKYKPEIRAIAVVHFLVGRIAWYEVA